MNQGYSDGSEVVLLVKAFEEYIKRILPTMQRSEIEKKRSFMVDLKIILEDADIKEKIPELGSILNSCPQRIIDCLGLAAHQVLTEELETELREETMEILGDAGEEVQIEDAIPEVDLPLIHARLVNHAKFTQLKNLKASYYGKLVSVKGTVVRVSNIKPLCQRLAFSCIACGMMHGLTQPEGRYTLPNSCPMQNCRSRSFIPDRSHKLTQTVDFQTIRLQEIISDDQREGGRVPRTVDCELLEDLVDTCLPGDMVTVTGIVKVSQNNEGPSKGGRNSGDKCMFSLYLDATSVTNCKAGGDSASAAGIEFNIKDYYAIQEIQEEKQLFRLLVGSLCPAIYGHEMVKAGLLLCMFGGCTKSGADRVPVRGDPHILVVGDPGLGKSQMLQACASVAPRGVYVCGNTTTKSGLTVTLSREGGGDYALEGGALVLADQGVCCIDEFDKMGNQHEALMEAMEQQSISIAKAGIVCSLPARASILAAANPVGGHYNKGKTVSENIKMNTALLSRFDLVFILMDKPDEELDCLLSEHVMANHGGGMEGARGHAAVKVRREDLLDTGVTDSQKTLRERLKFTGIDDFDPIPHQLLRKYICYARKYVRPKITNGAAQIIQQFYLDLRLKHQNQDSTPITTRQLESLIRLTEARARCELREEATDKDALDVVQIMKFSMIDTYSDEFGSLDFQRSQHGSGTSSKSQMKKFVSALQRMADAQYKSIFSFDEMREIAKQAKLDIRNFGDFVSSLNLQGYLIKKGNKVYQLITAE